MACSGRGSQMDVHAPRSLQQRIAAPWDACMQRPGASFGRITKLPLCFGSIGQPLSVQKNSSSAPCLGRQEGVIAKAERRSMRHEEVRLDLYRVTQSEPASPRTRRTENAMLKPSGSDRNLGVPYTYAPLHVCLKACTARQGRAADRGRMRQRRERPKHDDAMQSPYWASARRGLLSGAVLAFETAPGPQTGSGYE